MNVIVKRKNFTTITSAAIRDKRLSLKARGLLCFCMSLSDKWKYSVQGLATAAGVGIDSIKSAIKELEQCGYLVRTKYRDEHGRMACDYVISDQPVEEQDIEQPEQKEEICKQDSSNHHGKTAAEKPPRENHHGKTAAEKPPRENHHGKTAAENPPLSNIKKYKSKSINQKVIINSSSSSSNNNIYNNARNDEPCVSSAAAENAITFWMNNTGQFGEVIRSDIADLTKRYGEAVVIEAMREAIRSNVRTIKYVKAIVERMASGQERKKGCDSFDAAFEALYGKTVRSGGEVDVDNRGGCSEDDKQSAQGGEVYAAARGDQDARGDTERYC